MDVEFFFMNYPVDNAFFLHHAVFVFRRCRLFLLFFALTVGLLLGIGAWLTVPVKYQLNGIFLLHGVSGSIHGNEPGLLLEKSFRQELNGVAGEMEPDIRINSQIVAGAAVVYWNALFTDRLFTEKISGAVPLFSHAFQKKYPLYKLDFAVNGKTLTIRSFKHTLFRVAGGCGAGFAAGLLAAFCVAMFHKRSA